MAIYFTGDMHGDGNSVRRMGFNKFPEGRELCQDDCLIITGDFGFVWSDPRSANEKYWLDWMSKRPHRIMLVEGNHDNHWLLNSLPLEPMYGSFVGKVCDNVYHLKRGNVYQINGKNVFCFGGAQTTDMESKILKGNNKFKIVRRVEGKDWWPEELPSDEDKERAWGNLRESNYEVDYIVAHTMPSRIIELYDKVYCPTGRKNDPTANFLQEVCDKVKFRKYYCGHFHDDYVIENYHMLFDKIVMAD